MEEFEKDQVIGWYEWLEEQLLDIMEILPLAPENLDSYSPRLASLVLDSCGLLDSVFRQITPNQVLADIRQQRNRDADIADFARLYSANFNLPTLKSIPIISPPRYLCPFKPWEAISSGGDYEPLPWWQTYNDLKHNRIANINKAGLGITLEALCGLHQVISVLPALSRAVLRAGWIETSEFEPEYLLELMNQFEARSPVEGFLVESKLFIVPRGVHVPNDINYFKPPPFSASNRARQFFARSQ